MILIPNLIQEFLQKAAEEALPSIFDLACQGRAKVASGHWHRRWSHLQRRVQWRRQQLTQCRCRPKAVVPGRLPAASKCSGFRSWQQISKSSWRGCCARMQWCWPIITNGLFRNRFWTRLWASFTYIFFVYYYFFTRFICSCKAYVI